VQLDTFAASVWARMHGQSVPEGGYPGQYVHDIAQTILAEDPEIIDQDYQTALPQLRRRAYELQLADIQQTLEEFKVHCEVWCSDAQLQASGAVEDALERLKAHSHTCNDGGAYWRRTTDVDEELDRVLIKADVQPSYFA